VLGADKRSGRDTGGSSIVDATLLAAIEDGDALAVQISLAAGASLSATDEWGTTCLYAAVKTGQTEVLTLILQLLQLTVFWVLLNKAPLFLV